MNSQKPKGLQIRHKFNAVRTECGGISFPSKAEARYYEELKLRQKAGQVLFFLRQVPIDFPGGKYVVDFLEFWQDGTVHFVEVKGFETPQFKTKRAIVESLYPFKLEMIK